MDCLGEVVVSGFVGLRIDKSELFVVVIVVGIIIINSILFYRGPPFVSFGGWYVVDGIGWRVWYGWRLVVMRLYHQHFTLPCLPVPRGVRV